MRARIEQRDKGRGGDSYRGGDRLLVWSRWRGGGGRTHSAQKKEVQLFEKLFDKISGPQRDPKGSGRGGTDLEQKPGWGIAAGGSVRRGQERGLSSGLFLPSGTGGGGFGRWRDKQSRMDPVEHSKTIGVDGARQRLAHR